MSRIGDLDAFLEEALRESRAHEAARPIAIGSERLVEREGSVVDQADRYRADLARRSARAANQAFRAYVDTRNALRARLRDLEAKMKKAAAAGEDLSAGWLYQQQRLQTLLEHADREVLRYARRLERHLVDAQRDAIAAAQQHTATMVGSQLAPAAGRAEVSFTRLNGRALEEILAQVSGGPVQALLASLGPDAARELGDVLVRGVGLGQSPRTIAQRLRRVVDVPRARAQTIARTEVTRAYRTSAQQAMLANPNVVAGWVWTASLAGSCPVCVAMHGTFHQPHEVFASHPNCRCAPTPVTKSWEELGISGVRDARPVIEPGVEWFARQPVELQRQVLGPGKHDLYTAGDLQLADLVGYRVDPAWGPVRFEKPLTAVA